MTDMKANLDRFLIRRVEEGHIPGVDCSVFHHHKEIYRFQYGYADIENKIPITENTLYNIYSNSKVITCVAALQLFEKGEFVLDDPLYRFFPEMKDLTVQTPDGEIKPAQNHIKIRDLFRMTSGVRTRGAEKSQEVTKRIIEENNGVCPLVRLPQYLAEIPLLFEPGTEYNYGLSHEILGSLVAKITGMSFTEYLKKNIFEPLGMKNTAFRLEDCESKELAIQYEYNDEKGEYKSLGAPNCLLPSFLKESGTGGLISSVNDYNAFQEALCKGNTILRRATINLMRQDQLSGKLRDGYGGTPMGWGYGLGVRMYIDPGLCGMPIADFKPGFTPFGWGGAAGTYGSIDPENEISIFYAQHIFGSDEGLTHNGIRNIVYAALL
ncbi:MAG: beta-lactamase family protein [Ruminococcaceae bacterium]|nr:beta-lactamase family protein [Oscillospiraceae bacterium]